MRAYRIIRAVLVGALVLGFTLPVAAQDKTVTVEGQGVVISDDAAMARDKAVEDALRKAVEQVVGTQVSSESVVENYQLLEDRIYTNAKGFISNYKILSSSREGNVVTVKVEATVGAGKLSSQLEAIGVLLQQMENPKIMILVSEQNIGQEYVSHWWGASAAQQSMSVVENTIIEVLQAKGFEFVDHQTLAGKIEVNDAYKISASPTNQQAKQIANLSDAQVVIVGQAVAKNAGTIRGTSMNSGQANMSVRAVNTSNGDVIATSTKHQAAVHIDPTTAGSQALIKVSQKVAEDLVTKILDKWQKDVASAKRIRLIVSGVSDYNLLVSFKSKLGETVRGVKSVIERRVDGGVAEMDVRLAGTASHFAKELTAKNFGDITVKVLKVEANLVKVQIKK